MQIMEALAPLVMGQLRSRSEFPQGGPGGLGWGLWGSQGGMLTQSPLVAYGTA